MIPFAVVMLDELVHSPPEVALPQRNHPVETLALNRSYEPFRVRIDVGRMKRTLHDSDAGLFKEPSNRWTPLPVSITDQEAVADQHALIHCGERATDLTHEQIVGMWRRAHDLHPS